MEIIQIIGIAIISTILCLFIKKDRPEFANFIAITAGVIILLSVILKLSLQIRVWWKNYNYEYVFPNTFIYNRCDNWDYTLGEKL